MRAPVTVTLAEGARAVVVLRIVEAGNFPRTACSPTIAAGLRVSTPNQRGAKIVRYPFDPCGRRGR